MDEPIIDTAYGKLRGTIRKNLDGEDFYCFLGVPYAKPPVGELRFKAPVLLEPWTGIKDATKQKKAFYQRGSLSKVLSGTEDGLHLNIFTKKPLPQSPKLKPVMVWIFGGGFIEGKNNIEVYGPEFLMLENVVLVSINYRLGFLGFLDFEDPSLEVYGNAGLKDQIAALKWIRKNIENFWGDPNNITIFGQSAGGASVQYLILSPAAKGLFHRAIIQSGSVLNYWAYGNHNLKSLLRFLNKQNLSEREALAFLRSLSIEELYDIQEKYFKSLPMDSVGILAPIAERPNPTAVITKHPIHYLISGDYNNVPIIIGYNLSEALIFKAFFADSVGVLRTMKYTTAEQIASMMLNVKSDSYTCKEVGRKLCDIYGQADKKNFRMSGDFYFIMGIIASALLHAKTSDSPVFLYRMSLDAGLNLAKRSADIPGPGALHGDEIGYLFQTTLPVDNGSNEDKYLRRFVKLWTNFAKYGNPTPKETDLGIIWKPIHGSVNYFLDINKELVLGTDPDYERVSKWREIFKRNVVVNKL